MIHVRTFTGAGNGSITDMTHAGKRGRRCPVVRFSGWSPHGGDEFAQRCAAATMEIIWWMNKLDSSAKFEDVAAELRRRVDAFNQSEPDSRRDMLTLYGDESIRGIDAPRPKLTAGVQGIWSASADESGICIRDLADFYNEWTEITSRQTKAAAYAIAVKVWPQVQAAKTRGEASEILNAAGAKLHGYCAVD